MPNHPEDKKSSLDIARRTIDLERLGLEALAQNIDASFNDVIDCLYQCSGRIIITGIGKSGHIGGKIAATLASTGSPAQFLHAAEAAHGDLGFINKNDVVLAISNSGESNELDAIVHYTKRFSISLIALTANGDSRLAKQADYLLIIPKAEEACPLSLAPMTSTTLTLVMGDAVAAALLERRGFGKDDFATFHPGGKLGAQLMRLRDILDLDKTLADIRFVKKNSTLQEVVATITEGKRGLVAVLDEQGKTVGVVTDGDLRRGMFEMDINKAAAKDMMSSDPIRIIESALVAEAINLCETHSVNALLVIDHDDMVKGIVHLQDLLKLGAV